MTKRWEAVGWRGIGVPVEIASPEDAFLAVCNDPDDGRPAVSVWVDPNGWGYRDSAFWMTPDGARKLALSLMALAERAESSGQMGRIEG